MYAVSLPETAEHASRYAGLRMRPLRIVAEIETGSNVVSYDPVNLDNLLARRVVEEATQGRTMFGFADSEYLSVPVPLACLWRDQDGVPLYAATPFVPSGEAVEDVVYWHKRAQEGAFTRGGRTGTWSPKSAGLRFSDRRIGTPATTCDTWAATCVGNAEEVAHLLETVTSIGKRRGAGHGVIRSWTIAPADSFRLVRDGRLTRTLPADARHLLGVNVWPEGAAVPLGWTPPYWRPALFRDGWRIGTPVHVLGEGL